MTLEDLKRDLDDDQLAAVTAPPGNMLCIANAGSGKTRVLTYRIAHMIDDGEPEDSFIMLTFTVKAAREMMDRIKGLLHKDKLGVLGGTFHSVALRFIRRAPYLVGLDSHVTVLDERDACDIIGVVRELYCAEQGINRRNFPKKELIAGTYSYCRNTGMTFRAYSEQFGWFSGVTIEDIQEVIDGYESRKRASNSIDFDDILILFDRMLDDPGYAAHIHRQYPNIFVDEFQDINFVQASIVKKLVGKNNRLTAVGDDAQCIYGFRGSDIRFIRDFTKTYPDAKKYPIRTNYRSVNSVVDLAISIINRSPDYKECPKEMLSVNQTALKPTYKEFGTEALQADYIVDRVKDAYARGIPYDEMAVLCRMNMLPKQIELALTNAGIPVVMECGISFYERAHIRPILDYFKLLYSPCNELAFWNLFELVDGVGPKKVRSIFDIFSSKHGCDIAEVSQLTVPKKGGSDFQRLAHVLQEGKAYLDAGAEHDNETSVLQTLCSFFLDDFFLAKMRTKYSDEERTVRVPDFDILKSALAGYNSLEEFLENVALDAKKEDRKKKEEPGVHIMSIHKAKGLEWDKVFLPFLNDDILPHGDDLEEERRLCYVAVTRARKELDMTSVMFFPRLNDFSGRMSEFLTNQTEAYFERLPNEPTDYDIPRSVSWQWPAESKYAG